MIDEYITIVKKELGDSAAIEKVVALMVKQGALEFQNVRRVLIIHEFDHLYATQTKRTAMDIEHEIAARYNMSQRNVAYIRDNSIKRKREKGF